MLTWQTAYLKAHHRVEFVAANMSCEMSSSDKIKDFVDDARRAGIPVLPPDIERSEWEFLPEGDGIRFGFGAVKGTGKKAIEAFQEGRSKLVKTGKKLGLHSLCAEIDPTEMTRLAWDALIKAGAFDGTGHNRGAVLAALDAAMSESARAASDRRSGQGALFGGFEEAQESTDDSDGIDDAKALDRMDTLRLEHEVLGFYISGHPLEERAGLFAILSTTNTRDLQQLPGGAEVTLGGLIVGMKEVVTRAGKKMARFRLEDLQGGVQVICFPRTYERYREALVDDSVVICRAKVEERDEDAASQAGLLLEEVMDLEQALQSFRGGLVIRVSSADQPKMPALVELVGGHRGGNRLFFEVEGTDGSQRRIRAAERHGVKISAELAQEIDGLLGQGRTKLARI